MILNLETVNRVQSLFGEFIKTRSSVDRKRDRMSALADAIGEVTGAGTFVVQGYAITVREATEHDKRSHPHRPNKWVITWKKERRSENE